MRHYYKVISYEERPMAHRCIPSDSDEAMLIDIMVNGDLKDRTPEELVGKTISCDYTYPWLSIAMGVRIE